LLKVNKQFCKIAVNYLINELQATLDKQNGKVKQLTDVFIKLTQKYSIDELTNKPPSDFILSRGTVKAIDLLNDQRYTKIFVPSVLPHDDILLIYRLYFMLINKHDISNITNKNEFWLQTCNFFLNECNNEIGAVTHELVKNINFSADNLVRIKKLVDGNSHKITPSYFSKLCGTTGLFVFLLKDAFEYVGIIIDYKKTPVYNQYKLEKYHQDIIMKKLASLKKLQTIYT
jgi:hypothetical protein